MYKTVALACDHAGFSLKNELMLHLSSRGIEFRDFGTYNEESCDYPDFAAAACRAVLSGECDCAILVCGTGVGMSIAAKEGHPISWGKYCKVSAPASVIVILISMVCIYLRYF